MPSSITVPTETEARDQTKPENSQKATELPQRRRWSGEMRRSLWHWLLGLFHQAPHLRVRIMQESQAQDTGKKGEIQEAFQPTLPALVQWRTQEPWPRGQRSHLGLRDTVRGLGFSNSIKLTQGFQEHCTKRKRALPQSWALISSSQPVTQPPIYNTPTKEEQWGINESGQWREETMRNKWIRLWRILECSLTQHGTNKGWIKQHESHVAKYITILWWLGISCPQCNRGLKSMNSLSGAEHKYWEWWCQQVEESRRT